MKSNEYPLDAQAEEDAEQQYQHFQKQPYIKTVQGMRLLSAKQGKTFNTVRIDKYLLLVRGLIENPHPNHQHHKCVVATPTPT
jgi:hypothetical protein